jgi:hypothetical protein
MTGSEDLHEVCSPLLAASSTEVIFHTTMNPHVSLRCHRPIRHYLSITQEDALNIGDPISTVHGLLMMLYQAIVHGLIPIYAHEIQIEDIV